MRLHVFNPEHDLALAANLSNFTAPHAGRHLRSDLGFLPALWADEDDVILVENVAYARRAYGRLRTKIGREQRHFVDKSVLSHLDVTKVEPWGWDLALRSFLLRHGVRTLPSEEEIAVMRDLSHRKYAAQLLNYLLDTMNTKTALLDIKEQTVCNQLSQIRQGLEVYHQIVVKAPWSSSGRGVRFIDENLSDYQERWIHNIIEKQGSIIMEPFYNKVKDFGMEFNCQEDGSIAYAGLSLFHTKNGAYTGNIIAEEEDKRQILSHYIPVDLLDDIRLKIEMFLAALYKGKYHGPLGVDMMIVASPDKQGFFIHPCVEINLRRTMGHVANSITPYDDGFKRIMQIEFTDKYRIKILKQ